MSVNSSSSFENFSSSVQTSVLGRGSWSPIISVDIRARFSAKLSRWKRVSCECSLESLLPVRNVSSGIVDS